jgi:hypothetical protein
MDWHIELDGPVGKAKAERIKNWILKHPEDLDELMKFFLGDQSRRCQNAAMALSKIGDENPVLIRPYIPILIQSLNDNPIDAVKRNIVRLLQFHTIPEAHRGSLVQQCFDYLLDRQTPVAIRVFSMTIIGNHCLQYPELSTELSLILKDEMPYASAGFRSRARKILKQIERSI